MVRRMPWMQKSGARSRKSLGEATEPRRCFSKPHCLRASHSADTVSWWSEIGKLCAPLHGDFINTRRTFWVLLGSVNCVTLKVTKVNCLKFWNLCRNDTFVLNLDPNEIMEVCFLYTPCLYCLEVTLCYMFIINGWNYYWGCLPFYPTKSYKQL